MRWPTSALLLMLLPGQVLPAADVTPEQAKAAKDLLRSFNYITLTGRLAAGDDAGTRHKLDPRESRVTLDKASPLGVGIALDDQQRDTLALGGVSELCMTVTLGTRSVRLEKWDPSHMYAQLGDIGPSKYNDTLLIEVSAPCGTVVATHRLEIVARNFTAEQAAHAALELLDYLKLGEVEDSRAPGCLQAGAVKSGKGNSGHCWRLPVRSIEIDNSSGLRLAKDSTSWDALWNQLDAADVTALKVSLRTVTSDKSKDASCGQWDWTRNRSPELDCPEQDGDYQVMIEVHALPQAKDEPPVAPWPVRVKRAGFGKHFVVTPAIVAGWTRLPDTTFPTPVKRHFQRPRASVSVFLWDSFRKDEGVFKKALKGFGGNLVLDVVVADPKVAGPAGTGGKVHAAGLVWREPFFHTAFVGLEFLIDSPTKNKTFVVVGISGRDLIEQIKTALQH